MLGSSYYRLKRYAEAIDAYREAVRLKADYREAYVFLANALDYEGRYDDAVWAARYDPQWATAQLYLGDAYRQMGRNIEAIVAYKEAIRLKPDNADAHYGLGLSYLALKDRDSAQQEQQALQKLNPEMAAKLLAQIQK